MEIVRGLAIPQQSRAPGESAKVISQMRDGDCVKFAVGPKDDIKVIRNRAAGFSAMMKRMGIASAVRQILDEKLDIVAYGVWHVGPYVPRADRGVAAPKSAPKKKPR